MKLVKTFVALSLLIAAPFAFAQSSEKAIKIGIINMQRFTLQSDIGKASQARFDEFIQRASSDLQQEQQALQREQLELQNQQSVLSPEAFSARRNSLEQKLLAYRQKEEAVKRDMAKLQQEETANFLKLASPVIREVGKEMGFTLILDTGSTNGLVYWDETIDVTSILVDRLNAVTRSNTTSGNR